MNWDLWIQLFVRSALILGAAEGLRKLYKNRTAAARHRLLLWAFVLLFLLPLLCTLLPAIALPVWSEPLMRADVTVQQTSFLLAGHASRRALNWPVLIWLAGFACAILPLLAGAVAARRMVRAAEPIGDPVWDDLLSEFSHGSGAGRQPELLLSRKLEVPLTCGVLRSRILLPAAARTWSAERRRAVLLHELAHVRRRDVAVQIAIHIIVAFWWFQPLAWTLRRALRKDSELACDSEALGTGFRPSEYAAELLAIARGVDNEPRVASLGISMARRGDLEMRLKAVLAPGPALFPQKQMRNALWLLTAVAIGVSTVTATSQQTLYKPGGSMMKRLLFSGLLTSISLSAATISGSLFDPSGAAVPGAKVILSNPDTGAKQELASGPDGKFTLDEAPAGQYILRVHKAGLSSLFRVFDVKADSKIDRGFTLSWGNAREMNQLAPPDPQSKRVRVGGQVEESNLIKKVQPVYPAPAKSAGLQGTVELEASISAEGVPTELRVISSPGDDLTESALEAVRQWRYKPVLLNGQPVAIATDIIVNYTLTK